MQGKTRVGGERSAPEDGPVLVVVSDVEEEFDWSKPFDRRNTSVKAMSEIPRFQRLAEEYELEPTYVVDFPVASQPEGYEPLLEALETGRCEVGAHLHPWVNPPFEEEVNRFNSFAGNLQPGLERAKLSELSALLTDRFGVRPRVYKAGRYGLGPNTDRILEEEGFEVDLSLLPTFDFSDEGGPDFSQEELKPSFPLGKTSFLRIPHTGAYTGHARRLGSRIYPFANSGWMTTLRAPGILSRLGILDRLVLSPEGYSLAEMRRLTRQLLKDGLRVFCFSFHSPSLKPGCTPYVGNDSELSAFLENCRDYFEFFVSDLKGTGMTASRFRSHLLSQDN